MKRVTLLVDPTIFSPCLIKVVAGVRIELTTLDLMKVASIPMLVPAKNLLYHNVLCFARHHQIHLVYYLVFHQVD